MCKIDLKIINNKELTNNIQTKNNLMKSSKKLKNIIQNYEENNFKFENIFNEEKIKHHRMKNNFYTFKDNTTKLQVRILYKFIRKENNDIELELHKFYIKKNSRINYKKNFKDYVEEFVKTN